MVAAFRRNTRPDSLGIRRWWAGHYQKTVSQEQWCVARFVEKPTGEIKMALLSTTGNPDIFTVTRNSSNKDFIRFEMLGPEGMKIIAEQLYLGKRYGFQRLFGRHRDLWKKNIIMDFIKKNKDCAIRGEFDWGIRGESGSWMNEYIIPMNNFAIDPIEEDKLMEFWRTFVRPDQPSPEPKELLLVIGFLTD